MSEDAQDAGYEYVAYIDEAGDPGLKRLRPTFPTGSSEWFVLSGVVVSRANESNVRLWVEEMLEATRGKQKAGQRQKLHFRTLNDPHQTLICATLASKPVRCFVIASHKKSLLSWRPSRGLILMNNRDWFYNFLARYLLERITLFASQNSKKVHGTERRVKIVFSERGGLHVGQLGVYLNRLRDQSRRDTMVLKKGNLSWGVFDAQLLRHANHNVSAGLQLADIVASAFFRACDQYNTRGCDSKYAGLLAPVMARDTDKLKGCVSGFGVKVLPKFQPDEWLPIQSEIFSKFGYPNEWWAPVPSNPPRV